MPDRMWIYWPQQLSNRLWEATPAGPENGNPAASKSPNLIHQDLCVLLEYQNAGKIIKYCFYGFGRMLSIHT